MISASWEARTDSCDAPSQSGPAWLAKNRRVNRRRPRVIVTQSVHFTSDCPPSENLVATSRVKPGNGRWRSTLETLLDPIHAVAELADNSAETSSAAQRSSAADSIVASPFSGAAVAAVVRRNPYSVTS